MASLRDLLDRQSLRRLAGARSFARGETYFAIGRVRGLTEGEGGALVATVAGEQQYSVRLWSEGEQIHHSCTCPMFDSGAFCKHCVAVGLAYLERQQLAAVQPIRPEVVATVEDVRAYLLDQEREWLVDLVMEQVRGNVRLQERLLAKAAKERCKGLDMAPFLRAIDNAVYTDHLVDYGQMRDYVSDVDAVIGSVRVLLAEGYAAEVVALAEHFLHAVQSQAGMVDDSSGHIGSVLDTLRELHHEACLRARPDPVKLAGYLFQLELNGDYEAFHRPERKYADVLGAEGLAAYRALAEAEWNHVRPLVPGDKDPEYYGTRYHITSIAERMARDSGDVEALVAVLSRDLSEPRRFLKIAETYRDAGQTDEAMEWAERGLRAFPNDPAVGLREFLADEYHRRGRHVEAMALAWALFAESPVLGSYQRLRNHAELAGDWPAWRAKALQLLQEAVARARVGGWGQGSALIRKDKSELVRVYLWEQDVESAWREAQDGGCSDDLWLELATRRESTHPEDALPIFRAQIDPLVECKSNDAYGRAFHFVGKVRDLMVRLGRQREFATYLEELKARHRRKRNFMALLERL